MITDRLYHVGAYKAIQLQSNYSASYFYYFRYVTAAGSIPGVKSLKEKKPETQKDFLGVSHGDDIFLIYYNSVSRRRVYSEGDKIISRNLIKLYSDFSKHNSTAYGDLLINEVNATAVNCLEIFSPRNFSMTTKDDHFASIDFWNNLEINDA